MTSSRPARPWLLLAAALGAFALAGCTMEVADEDELVDATESSIDAVGEDVPELAPAPSDDPGGEQSGPEPTPWRGAHDDDSGHNGPPPPPDFKAAACESTRTDTTDGL